MAINNELWALDASTGELVTRFVDQGTLDLRCGLPGRWSRLAAGAYQLPVTVFTDLPIVVDFTSEDCGVISGVSTRD